MSRGIATPEPERRRLIVSAFRIARLLRRHLALAPVEIKRSVQLILLCQ
jgi:hypothetical protein